PDGSRPTPLRRRPRAAAEAFVVEDLEGLPSRSAGKACLGSHGHRAVEARPVTRLEPPGDGEKARVGQTRDRVRTASPRRQRGGGRRNAEAREGRTRRERIGGGSGGTERTAPQPRAV